MAVANVEYRAADGTGRMVSIACLLVIGICIGLTANLAKLAGQADIPPLAFLLWSVVGAGLVLGAVAAGRRQLPALQRRTGEYFLVSGLLSVALPNGILFLAVPHVGAGFAAMCFAFPPVFTYVMALVGRLERLQTGRAVGVGVGVLGAFVLAGTGSAEPGADPFWIAATLGAQMIVAAGNIYRTLRWPAGASPVALAPGMLLGAGLALAAGTWVLQGTIVFPMDSGRSAFLLAAQILVFSSMYVLYFVLQRRAGPVYLSQIGAVGAAAGATIAMFVLGEAPPPALGFAAIFIAAGVLLVTLSGGRGVSTNRLPARAPVACTGADC